MYTENENTWGERIILAAILLILVSFTYAVLDTLTEREELRDSRVSVGSALRETPGPDIPKCDKELWLRITEGCDDDEVKD